MSVAHHTVDRLRAVLHKPGPYLTAYFDVMDDDLARQWEALRPVVEEKQIPEVMRAAVEARIALPLADDVGGWGIIVAADGSTEVFTSPDAPRRPIVNLAAIPYMAPALEWEHRDVPHAVAVATADGIDIVPFVSGARPTVTSTSHADAAPLLARLVDDMRIDLVVVGGDPGPAADAAASFRMHLPATTHITVLDGEETVTIDEFSDAVVRQVSTVHAVRTVNALKEFRFEKSHGTAVEGTADVLRALREDEIRVLLIHDDPDDERVVAMHASDDFTSLGSVTGTVDETHAVRLVDAVIASALVHRAEIYIIPSTGWTGPTEDLGVILTDDLGFDVTAEAEVEAPPPETTYVDSPLTNAAEHGGGPIIEPTVSPGDEIVA